MKKDNNIILSNNLTYYMNKMKIDRNKLCKDLGFKYTTVSEWLSAQKYPRMDKIEKLANYFGVKKSDLIESKNPSLVKHNNEISESELQHIKKYRNLDDYGKEAVDSILNVEYKRCTSIVEERQKPIYISKTAARNGEPPRERIRTQEEIDEIRSRPDADPDL